MLDTLISSKTRIKLLLRFYLNRQARGYLRQLEEEFTESSNAIRLELNKFEQAGMLVSELEGNKKVFRVNTKHPLFPDIHQIVRKYVGLDRIVDDVARKLGDLQRVYLLGDYARGIDSGVIDLAFIGRVDEAYLIDLVRKAEALINRKVRYLLFEDQAGFDGMPEGERLVIWEASPPGPLSTGEGVPTDGN